MGFNFMAFLKSDEGGDTYLNLIFCWPLTQLAIIHSEFLIAYGEFYHNHQFINPCSLHVVCISMSKKTANTILRGAIDTSEFTYWSWLEIT